MKGSYQVVVWNAGVPYNVPMGLAPHNVEEFGHLATILPKVYEEFGHLPL